MRQTLSNFSNLSLFDAASAFLGKLGIKHSGYNTKEALPLEGFFDEMPQYLNDANVTIDKLYYLGSVNYSSFGGESTSQESKYEAMHIFALQAKLDANITRTLISSLTRAFNRKADDPVILIIRQGNNLTLSICDRKKGVRNEIMSKVTILRNINCKNPHRAHLDILDELNSSDCHNFDELYRKWINKFNIQALNNQFYKELQKWFYWAIDEITLPDYENTNLSKKRCNQNFIVRLLSRMMFCWFLKEKKDNLRKSVIDAKLLELCDSRTRTRYPIVTDINDHNFLESSSYYRGILQNIFFGGLNSNTKKGKNDFKCLRFLPADFDYSLFIKVPFLNGSTFRPLDEDFFIDSIADDAFVVPNYLFYGDENHRGINEVFNDYKFTVEENTPSDVDIALDPEMLGMVFENLLAEIDPQNEDAAKSIRKATGSYYTPRPVIEEMSNESLLQYLYRNINTSEHENNSLKEYLRQLIYNENRTTDEYDELVVNYLHNIKIIDPACGSGAFPMGMLQRIVDVLRVVDPHSKIWLQMMLNPIEDEEVRNEFIKQLEGTTSDYQRKLGIIRNCIYAIDIQPIAVQITKLRFFISLLADQEIDTKLPNCGILPFPNLETKIVCADSLKNIPGDDVFVYMAKEELIKARKKYYHPNISPIDREKVADEIADILDKAFPTFAEQINLPRVCNKAALKRWFIDANINAPFFDMDTFFPEVNEGFDIVIGNPPYGGFKITEEVRTALDLGSNDPYGAFIARFLGDGIRITPLKDNGTLAFIVSDTFMTIGSHLKLRQQMMRSRIHKMLRMSPKTFSATVNTVIIFCEKCKLVTVKQGNVLEKATDNAICRNICTMADMTNIDIHEDYKYFIEVLAQSIDMDSDKCLSNEEYAIYRYPQKLIRNCSNLPFFVASPKLFELMNDVNPVLKASTQINGNHVMYRINKINDKEVEVYKFGDISDVKVGLQTGDNPAYLYQNPDARGTYRDINDYHEYILTDEDLQRIHSNDSLRLSVINNGISKDNPNSERYFGGRYIARYDKGGESDADGGWMPNYYVPTEYYIDWSEWAVKRMRSLTVGQRDKERGETKTNKTPNKLCSRFQNSDSYFLPNIAFSRTGIYAPSFRVGEYSPYDSKCCAIYINTEFELNNSMALLVSKLGRYIQKTFINHTVEFGISYMKHFPFVKIQHNKIVSLVESIFNNQRNNHGYDYASHEQLEIDELVYEAYGLNDDDIKEVETWYVRRYPKLAEAQRRNLETVRQQVE